MKITLTLLAEFPGTKTVCILLARDADSLFTRHLHSTKLARLFVYDPSVRAQIMVTVVLKSCELPSEMIESLVTNFLARGSEAKGPHTVDVDDVELLAAQASRS